MAAEPNGTAPDYPAPPRKDEQAPFGRKDDGTPRLRRAGPGRPKPADKARTARSVPAAPAKDAKAPLEARDRRKGVDAVMQLTAGVLISFPATRPDAGALALHRDPLADAIVATAETDERFGRALDRLLDTGPYAALVMAVIPLTAQILVNHKVLPAGTLGTERAGNGLRMRLLKREVGVIALEVLKGRNAAPNVYFFQALAENDNGAECAPQKGEGGSTGRLTPEQMNEFRHQSGRVHG